MNNTIVPSRGVSVDLAAIERADLRPASAAGCQRVGLARRCAGNIRKDKMTVDELQEMFEKYQDDVSLDRLGVEMLGSKRDDLHAFELLDKLVPGKRGMVSGADHDVIYLDVELDDLKDIITDPQVVELVKCGVFFDHDVDCLAMFV
jgi:hypothetical protein